MSLFTDIKNGTPITKDQADDEIKRLEKSHIRCTAEIRELLESKGIVGGSDKEGIVMLLQKQAMSTEYTFQIAFFRAFKGSFDE